MADPRYFILVGDEYAWRTSIRHNIWGFSQRSIGNWNTSNIDDYVAFYATAPIKRIIGYGRITDKFISEDITWPDEKVLGKSIWKYRIRFEKLCSLENWEKGISVPNQIMLNTGRKVVDKRLFLKFVKELIAAS